MNTKIFGTNCVGIARVSTYVQDTTAQATTLQNKASELGLTIEKIFETKESGFISLDKKDGFGMLQEYLTTHNCKIVIVTELSRLARRKIILEQIKQWFLDNKIQLYVINISFALFDDFGNASSTSDMTFSIFATIAETEMKEKRIRFAQVHKDLNQQGLSILGKVLFGYERINRAVKINGRWRSKMEVKQEEADQIRQVYDWYLNGVNGDMTQCSIAKIRDECIARGYSRYLHSKRNVNKTLKCAFYTGEIINTQYRRKSTEYWFYKEEDAPKYVYSAPGTVRYPQIIPVEEFQAVQNKMMAATTRLQPDGQGGFSDQSRSHFTLLAKLVKCSCGLSMTGDYRKGRGHSGHEIIVKSYRCTNHAKHGSVTLPMRLIDFAVWYICVNNRGKYLEYLKSFPFQSSVGEVNERIENLEKEKSEIENKQRLLAGRFMQVRKYVTEESFNHEMDMLTKSYRAVDRQIWKERKRLKLLMDAKTDVAEYAEHLRSLEGDKEKMRLYIQRMVEQVRPLLRDHYYTVTEIVMRDLSFAVKTSEPDVVANGLADRVYVIFNTKNTIIPKIRYISGPCEFDLERKVFLLPNSDEGTLENVFDDEEEVYFRSLTFRPLGFDDSL